MQGGESAPVAAMRAQLNGYGEPTVTFALLGTDGSEHYYTEKDFFQIVGYSVRGRLKEMKPTEVLLSDRKKGWEATQILTPNELLEEPLESWEESDPISRFTVLFDGKPFPFCLEK